MWPDFLSPIHGAFVNAFRKVAKAIRLESPEGDLMGLTALFPRRERLGWRKEKEPLSPRQSRQARGRGDRVKRQIASGNSQPHLCRTDGFETYTKRLSSDLRDPPLVQAITQDQ